LTEQQKYVTVSFQKKIQEPKKRVHDGKEGKQLSMSFRSKIAFPYSLA